MLTTLATPGPSSETSTVRTADPVAASGHAAQALDWAEASGGPFSRVYVREGVAASHAHRGEWDRAIAAFGKVGKALGVLR